MKLGYFPSVTALLRNSTTREAQTVPRYRISAPKQSRNNSTTLVIDSHTQKDLEIFEADGSKSLFQLCNFTRTVGGAQILRQRMEQPFADRDSILLAQDSISHIRKHRHVYTDLSLWTTGRVERYQRDPLMFVVQKNRASFAIGATTLKLFDGHHYFRILRGVQFTCLFIQSLRAFLQQAAIHSVEGELAYICEDLNKLLNMPRFLEVPESELKGLNYLKVLRLDQSFRIYDREQVQELLRLSYEIDALISLADATSKHGYVIPKVLTGETSIQAEGLVNPQVQNPIPNDISLDQENKLLFLTGPNMAGKTTYLRAIATALYCGHLGMGVPATGFAFTPVERLFSSISINDNVHTGTSYFLAEVLRIKAIASAVAEGFRVVAIMDEPFKGTNVKDALEASSAVINRLVSKTNSLFLFSSHLIELDEEFSSSKHIKKCHFEAGEIEGKLHFDYLLQPGISSQRLGMRVLSDQGVIELLDR